MSKRCNFKLWITFNAYKRLSQTQEAVVAAKYSKLRSFFKTWYYSRFSWPRAVFFSNVTNSYAPASEATKANVLTFGVTDTNAWTQTVTLPIPGNDDSVIGLIFYHDLVSSFILLRKYTVVLMWFVNIRSVSRVVSFSKWIKDSTQKLLQWQKKTIFLKKLLNLQLLWKIILRKVLAFFCLKMRLRKIILVSWIFFLLLRQFRTKLFNSVLLLFLDDDTFSKQRWKLIFLKKWLLDEQIFFAVNLYVF